MMIRLSSYGTWGRSVAIGQGDTSNGCTIWTIAIIAIVALMIVAMAPYRRNGKK